MSMIQHAMREGWGALMHYRLRSALTVLSVVWGVASLLLLLAYGTGFGDAVTQAFDQIGKNLIVVFPGQTSRQAGGERAGRWVGLEPRDVEVIEEGVPAVEAVSPELRRFAALNFGYRTRDHSVCGVRACFERIRNLEVEDGRFLTDEDDLHRRRVVVIGADIRKELFGGRPAVDREIKVNGVRYRVIGVLRKKTQITNYNTPDDQTAFVPFNTIATQFNARYLNNLVVLPASNQVRTRVIEELRAALAREHHFHARDERAVQIHDWNEYRGMVTTMSVGLNLLLLIIGTLTLGISAVGVMNIMLVSVAERTREIGVLKAIGAKRREVLAQILFEGLTLTGTGGVLGFLLAAVVTRAIGSLPLLGPLFEDTSGRSDVHLALSGSAVLVSVLVLTAVGLLAGLAPAIRAARLHPVVAIRNE